MSRLIIILTSLIWTISSSNAEMIHKDPVSSKLKTPIVFYSKKVTIDKNLNQIIYEGNVVVEFAEYDIITSKIIFHMHEKGGKTQLNFADCPYPTKIVKKDLSETLYAKNLTFSSESRRIVSRGNVMLEKDNRLISTEYMEIELSESDNLKELGINN